MRHGRDQVTAWSKGIYAASLGGIGTKAGRERFILNFGVSANVASGCWGELKKAKLTRGLSVGGYLHCPLTIPLTHGQHAT